jgi:hypothetical protein
MRRRVPVFVCFAVALMVAAGCSRGDVDEPAVATPSLTLNHTRVPIGSPLTLTYKFQVAPDAKIDGDYTVFVHVLDPDGEQLWTDDHQPPTPTSAWKPGEVVEYTRRIFVPNYPYIGEAHIRLGLYRGDSRLTLSGQEVSRKEYVVSTFQLLPQSENVFLIYKDGWHQSEVAADNAAVEWQWTQKAATVSFRNPKKDVVFFLEADGRPDQAGAPQQVTLRIGDQIVGTFAVDFSDRKLQTFPITAAQLGTGDMTELVIEVDRTFTAPGDTRELGLRVFHAFIDPR